MNNSPQISITASSSTVLNAINSFYCYRQVEPIYKASIIATRFNMHGNMFYPSPSTPFNRSSVDWIDQDSMHRH
ncbi:hypothetical protein VNO77_22370 [Canavalia gladiata]|uniref:Uncharacterized protein n=1 Tax=Canavalia gladiata TaxID=3824 RepID=A0AAN9L523_CANGL